MLTGMTERDWQIALEVFDAVQSSRESLGMTTVNSWRQSTISRSTELSGDRCPKNLQLEQRMEPPWRLSRSVSLRGDPPCVSRVTVAML